MRIIVYAIVTTQGTALQSCPGKNLALQSCPGKNLSSEMKLHHLNFSNLQEKSGKHAQQISNLQQNYHYEVTTLREFQGRANETFITILEHSGLDMTKAFTWCFVNYKIHTLLTYKILQVVT